MKMRRGDTARFSFKRRDKNDNVITVKADKLYFTVKPNYYINNFVLQKTIDDMTFDEGKYTFTIEPNDTELLEYGDYVYDIEVITNDYKKTISIGDFIINEEVTFKVNED